MLTCAHLLQPDHKWALLTALFTSLPANISFSVVVVSLHDLACLASAGFDICKLKTSLIRP